MHMLGIVNLFIIVLWPVITVVIAYFVIKAAVKNAIGEALKANYPGEKFFKAIIRDAVQEALEESKKSDGDV